MSRFPILFLTRRGCHLCDDARPLVTRAAGLAGVPLNELDIDHEDTLLAAYGLRIPVILSGSGDVLAEGVIEDERALYRAFRKLARDD